METRLMEQEVLAGVSVGVLRIGIRRDNSVCF